MNFWPYGQKRRIRWWRKKSLLRNLSQSLFSKISWVEKKIVSKLTRIQILTIKHFFLWKVKLSPTWDLVAHSGHHSCTHVHPYTHRHRQTHPHPHAHTRTRTVVTLAIKQETPSAGKFVQRNWPLDRVQEWSRGRKKNFNTNAIITKTNTRTPHGFEPSTIDVAAGNLKSMPTYLKVRRSFCWLVVMGVKGLLVS